MTEMHDALDVAHRRAVEWLDSLPGRRVPPSATSEEVAAALGDLPEGPRPATEVVQLLATRPSRG